MQFEYVPGKPKGPHERAVRQAGFPWEHTNHVSATEARPFDITRIDRILEHSHHGRNTHLIFNGDLDVKPCGKTSSGSIGIIRANRGVKEVEILRPKQCYHATSEEGATFVEGHQCLSPRIAERFMGRGSLNPVLDSNPDNGWGSDLPDIAKVKEWLRKADFRPAQLGKEQTQSIITFKGSSPLSDGEIGAQRQLQRWFREEWARRNNRHIRSINVEGLYNTGHNTIPAILSVLIALLGVIIMTGLAYGFTW